MQLLTDPVYVIVALLLAVAIAEWLAQKKAFRKIGGSLLVILLTAVIANLGLLPTSTNPSSVYPVIFEYAAPLGIFFLLLDVKLGSLRQAGLPMLTLFVVGSLSTMAGVLLGYYLITPVQDLPLVNAIAGMYTGTYTGGSANLNAVALNYKVMKHGTLFAAINAVDNIVGTTWIMITLILPGFLQKYFPRRRNLSADNQDNGQTPIKSDNKEELTIFNLSMLLLLAFGSYFMSAQLAAWLPGVPFIILLTIIALLLAQIPFVHRLKGAKTMGYFLILLFLAVVGAYCNLGALSQSGEQALVLLYWVTAMILVHGLLLFGITGLFKQDWAIAAVASNANVGGTATAAVCAVSIGRPDLQVPGLLVAAVGNGAGTFLGVLVAEMLK